MAHKGYQQRFCCQELLAIHAEALLEQWHFRESRSTPGREYKLAVYIRVFASSLQGGEGNSGENKFRGTEAGIYIPIEVSYNVTQTKWDRPILQTSDFFLVPSKQVNQLTSGIYSPG